MGFVVDFIGDITGANKAAQGQIDAGNIQAAASEKGIAEQRMQFDKLVELMKPYLTTGQEAFGQQRNIIGLGGEQAQYQAIQGIENSPLTQSLFRQGEDAILQNSSATGGLRGGNTQGALAQFRPSLLSQLIEQQYTRLGGMSQLGQAAASGQATYGMQMADNISNLLSNQGSALAGGAIAAGNRRRNAFGDAVDLLAAIVPGLPSGGVGF